MKKLATAALSALALATILPSSAKADYTEPWFDKPYYGAFEAYGAGWDFLYGGGLSLGIDLVAKDYVIGIGARSGFGFWAGSDGSNGDYTDETWDNDVMLELWVSDYVILYGGVGITFHLMENDRLVESESYNRRGRSWRYTYQLKTVRYESGAATDTQVWFAGARCRVQDHFFIFAEYRQTSGTIEMTTDDLDYHSKLREIELDMDASCFMIGVGWLF